MGLGLLGYNIYLFLLGVFSLPVAFIRSITKKRHWAVIPRPRQAAKTMWMLAESAGEVILAKTLISAFAEKKPEVEWLIITTTNSGYQMAKRLFGESDAAYIPFDYGFFIMTLLKRYHPFCVLLIENFFWPNMIRAMSVRRIDTVVVNARISERVLRRNRFFGDLFRRTVQRVSRFYLQNEINKEDYLRFGVKNERLFITGDLKFDQQLPSSSKERTQTFLGRLALTPDERLIVAGSTHPGEELIVLEAFRQIRKAYPDSRLLLAPRHLNRVDEVGELLKHHGFGYQRFSSYQNYREDIILLDTMGDLFTLYGMAYVSIVGGSFVEEVGGHNILEPAAQGSPVFYGPYIEGFKAPHEILSQAGVGFLVSSPRELAEGCLRILQNPLDRQTIGTQAKRVIAEHQGVSVKIADSVLDWLSAVK